MSDTKSDKEPADGQTMTAVYVSGADTENPLSVLKIGPLPVPPIPEGYVRVKMAAAGMNYHDIFSLTGIALTVPTYPRILGCEGAGYLDDGTPVILYPLLGDPEYFGDETINPKRDVFSESADGTFAEYVVVPRRNTLPRPAELDDISASVLGAAWLTAYRMIFTKSGLKPGQIMLVQGSSGGVATALIQLGSAAGMRVWVTGRTEEKRNLGLELGAERAFAPGAELPSKVDSVFDLAGEATWAHSMASVKMGGSVVTCGVHAGASVSVELHQVFVNQVSIQGAFLGSFQEFKDLIQYVVGKRISPKIGKIVAVSNAHDAFEAMYEGRTDGKIVVTF